MMIQLATRVCLQRGSMWRAKRWLRVTDVVAQEACQQLILDMSSRSGNYNREFVKVEDKDQLMWSKGAQRVVVANLITISTKAG